MLAVARRAARRRAAAATAIAENVPASHSLVRPPAWNGTLRTEPRPTSPPDSACTMNSVVGPLGVRARCARTA